MAKKAERIEHSGVIEQIASGIITVNILQQAACLSCSVKGACSASESDNKLIEIKSFAQGFRAGQRVMVFYERSLGFKALWWAYVLPFVLLMLVLIVGVNMLGDEALAGLIALASLIPYYGLLYLLRDSISREFAFRIEPLKETTPQLSQLNLEGLS